MAVNKTIKVFAILIVILAGAMAILIVRTRLLSISIKDESRFVEAYVGLTIANSNYGNRADSLQIAREIVFNTTSTDSAWIADYGKSLAEDPSRSSRVWDQIIVKLDSIRAVPPEPDTVQMF
jgi:hypothetical protein